MFKKPVLLVLLIVDLVIVAVAGVWLFKNIQKGKKLEPALEPVKEERVTAPPVPSGSRPTVKAVRNILFQYKSSLAKEVSVAGDFNDWQAELMEKSGGHIWKKSKQIEPGEYTYKFVVDGRWIKDPFNPRSIPDGYGSENSLLVVKPK